MKIAAFLGIKDEASLLRQCVEHLRQIGVNKIIACDMGSTDGSLEILEDIDGDDIELLLMDDGQNSSFEQWSQIAGEKIRESGADWGIFLDADEFWLPSSGSLQTALSAQDADIFRVNRFNVILTDDGPSIEFPIMSAKYGEILMAVKIVPDFRRKFEAGHSIPWSLNVPVPKIAVRTHLIGEVDIGGHDVEASARKSIRREVASHVVIAHVPFTTEQRFYRKIESLKKVIKVHGQFFGNKAWHWRRWAQLNTENAVKREYRNQVFSKYLINQLRRNGTIVSASEILK